MEDFVSLQQGLTLVVKSMLCVLIKLEHLPKMA